MFILNISELYIESFDDTHFLYVFTFSLIFTPKYPKIILRYNNKNIINNYIFILLKFFLNIYFSVSVCMNLISN